MHAAVLTLIAFGLIAYWVAVVVHFKVKSALCKRECEIITVRKLKLWETKF